ncbi:Hypothetical protein A7982_05205 [Minicystis rosea]|nr:Hypothetical protein A7982_05205 [Minicystis rosea]
MRTLASFAWFALGIALTACGTAPREPEPQPEPEPEVPSSDHTLTIPASFASSREVIAYAKLDQGSAIELTELDYGLHESFPTHITLSSKGGYVLAKECETRFTTMVWKSITEVKGDAAEIHLDQGSLSVDLREEGDVSVLVEGEIVDQACSLGDGPVVTTIPLRHRITLHVHRVAGFVVEQFQQVARSCWDSLVLPSGAPLWAPTAKPRDAEGQRFDAANAPVPVTLTMRSKGMLSPWGGQYFMAEAGTVSVSADTTLPVSGLASFEVVGPETLTSVDATLHLHRTAAKGSVSNPIEEGMTYQLFYPDMSNGVAVHVDAAMTDRGKLCENVPSSWFSSTSATPSQCETGKNSEDALPEGFPWVASIRAAGECRLEVTIPGTNQKWTTKFSTTF